MGACVSELETQQSALDASIEDDHDASATQMLQKRSHIAAQACHASVLGGKACELAVIPSMDMLTLYSLSAGGHRCREGFIYAIRNAVGLSREWQ